jgi:hypothetical protein
MTKLLNAPYGQVLGLINNNDSVAAFKLIYCLDKNTP